MKCFTYTLNSNGQGPADRLPLASITGFYANNLYYGAAVVDSISNLQSEFNAKEITPLQFNRALTPAPTAEVPNPTPALTALEPSIRMNYAKRMSDLAAPYSPEERETWFVQVSEAVAFQANNSASTPLLSAIATVRGYTVSELATAVIAKDNAFRNAIGTILGEQQKLIESLWVV